MAGFYPVQRHSNLRHHETHPRAMEKKLDKSSAPNPSIRTYSYCVENSHACGDGYFHNLIITIISSIQTLTRVREIDAFLVAAIAPQVWRTSRIGTYRPAPNLRSTCICTSSFSSLLVASIWIGTRIRAQPMFPAAARCPPLAACPVERGPEPIKAHNQLLSCPMGLFNPAFPFLFTLLETSPCSRPHLSEAELFLSSTIPPMVEIPLILNPLSNPLFQPPRASISRPRSLG
jgi:hypothetical protein